jgi:hypothetical protein
MKPKERQKWQVTSFTNDRFQSYILCRFCTIDTQR